MCGGAGQRLIQADKKSAERGSLAMSELKDQTAGQQPGVSPRFLARTAMAAARVRATMLRPSTAEGDPDAQRRLCSGMQTARWRPPRIVTRTRFFDTQVLEAISAGVRQVVVCSAGYDDRALRFRSPGVRFFEIDHPAMVADKAGPLRAIGVGTGTVVQVSADVRDDDFSAALSEAGHDPGSPSLFLCEGLFAYLHRQAVGRLLAGLRSRAAAGTALAATLATHEEGMDSAQFAAAANARRRDGGEQWLTILPRSGWIHLLASTGWQAERLVDPASLNARVPRGFSLLLVARPASTSLAS